MLKAGFCKLDITPPLDCALLGYDFRQTHLPAGAEGVLDPLLARVLVLEEADDRAEEGDSSSRSALVCLDLCILMQPTARRLRARIAEAIDTSPDRVILACSHTHSGPMVVDGSLELRNGAAEEAEPDGDIAAAVRQQREAAVAYAARLESTLVEAATRAAHKMYPVELSVAEAPLGIAYNRRVPTDSGTQMCWSPQEQHDLSPGPADDPTCTVLLVRQLGGPRQWVVFSVGAHGTVLGKTSRGISADWPGAACRLINEWLPNAEAMYLFGACGDAHPWIATQEDPAACEVVGRAAAGLVTLLTHATRPVPADRETRLNASARTVKIGTADVDIAAWTLGPCVLLALPVEMFGKLAMDLRRRINRPILLATVANGFLGYWPTKEAFAEGAYEVDAAKRNGREAGDGERLIEEVVRLIEELEA